MCVSVSVCVYLYIICLHCSVLGAISMGYVVILVAAKYLIEGPRDGVEIVTRYSI